VRATRDDRSASEANAYRRRKSARAIDVFVARVQQTLALKQYSLFEISTASVRPMLQSIGKSARSRVARTPNRGFGNKKIFRENGVYGSSPLASHQFWLESIGADSRRAGARKAANLQTS
jgi:hypothetical protein